KAVDDHVVHDARAEDPFGGSPKRLSVPAPLGEVGGDVLEDAIGVVALHGGAHLLDGVDDLLLVREEEAAEQPDGRSQVRGDPGADRVTALGRYPPGDGQDDGDGGEQEDEGGGEPGWHDGSWGCR